MSSCLQFLHFRARSMIAQDFESMCLSSWCVLPGSMFRRRISSSSSGFRYCSFRCVSFGSQFGFGWKSDGVQMGSDIVFFYQQNAAGSLKTHFRCSEWTSQSLMGSRGFEGHQVSRAGIFDVRWFSNASWASWCCFEEYDRSLWPSFG